MKVEKREPQREAIHSRFVAISSRQSPLFDKQKIPGRVRALFRVFFVMVHFVIILSISKVFQVQNKPMGFLPPLQMKGLITIKLIHAEYNPIHNSIDINHYNGYILRIDCNLAESGIKTTPNSQRCLNALAIDNPLEYARLALEGEMQAWADAEDSLDIF